MKRIAALLLTTALVLTLSSALARKAECPSGGFSLKLPDSFEEQPLDSGDPDMCFYWENGSITIVGYRYYQGEIPGSSVFQVTTGNESADETVTVRGKQMHRDTGTDSFGTYIMYTWMDRGNSVTLYFYYPKGDSSARKSVENIMFSISFDAGH